MSEAGSWIQHEVEEGTDILYLAGIWRLANLAAIAAALRTLRLAIEAVLPHLPKD